VGGTINRRGQAVACLQDPVADYRRGRVVGYRPGQAVACLQDPEADYRRGRVVGYRRVQAVACLQDPVADYRRGLEAGCPRAPAVDFQPVLAEDVRPVRPANVLMGRKVT
jgi:hypothetical protein